MNGIIYHTYTSCHKRIHLDLVYLYYTSIEKHNENKPYLLVDEHGGRKYRHDFRHNNAYSRILLSIACSFQNNHVLMILWNYSSDRAGIQNSKKITLDFNCDIHIGTLVVRSDDGIFCTVQIKTIKWLTTNITHTTVLFPLDLQ